MLSIILQALALSAAPMHQGPRILHRESVPFRIASTDTLSLHAWLKERHWTFRSLGSGIVEVKVASDSLAALENVPGITTIEAAPRYSSHALDESRTLIRAAPVHRGTGLSKPHHGTKSLIGIVDVGFDLGHYAFLDSTGNSRIVRVWDHTDKTGKPPAGFTTGSLFSGAAIANLGHTASQSHHGTHVTGLAAGREWSPSGGEWWGVADDARIVLVECGNGCSAMNDGIKYIYQLADSLKLPAVVNLSWGNLNGPRDGNGTDCALMKTLVGPGKLAVVSAGNAGGQAGHAVHTFAGDTARLALQVSTGVETSGQDTIRKVFFNEVELWGDSALTYKSWVEFLDTNNTVLTTSPLETSGRTTWKNISLIKPSGKDTFWVSGNLERRAGKGGTKLSVSTNRPDTRLRVGITATQGTVHGWIWENGMSFLNPPSAECPKCIAPDSDHMISDKATCASVVSVGAVDGAGHATWFTSKGPGRATRVKPDLASPGFNIVSSLNSSVNDGWSVSGVAGPYTWGAMSGTSMSAPLVTGALALLLEANPKLTPDSAVALLKNKSTTFDPAIGWGTLDVLGMFEGLDPSPTLGTKSAPAPVPLGIRHWITPDGRRTAIASGSRPLDSHPGGIAWLQTCTDGGCWNQGFVRLHK
ncbi:MAG: hypothetical protein RL318_1780 [Fibrobacterota bacterium]|jgi:subtilisin family serine protease